MTLNLTQHPATAEQLAVGVRDVADRAALSAMLTFDSLPSPLTVWERALEVAALAAAELAGETPGKRVAMIGGAPFLMAPLEAALRERQIAAVYAFSVRASSEETQPDGSVRKVAMFRHAGFVGGSVAG